MIISVIVPAYNAAATLAECLAALHKQSRAPDEIIVVDDGSTDRTAELARASGARVLQQPNRGPAAARNLGVQNARGDLILFTDADCAPAPDWVAQMLAPFADAGISGAKGVYRTRQKSWTARFAQAEYEDKYDRMRRYATIDFIDTYSAAYRRAVYLANDGMDLSFPRASGEDVEFSYRLAQRGFKLVMLPSAVVYHNHPATLFKYLRRKFFVGYWRVRMYEKHPAKIKGDAHTPLALKIQMGLGLVFVGAALLSIVWRDAIIGGALALGALGLTTIPFAIKTFARDRAIALLAPGFLFLRAFALDAGFVLGLLQRAWQRIRG